MKHVVLLTIDTLRRDALGAYGCRLGLTPFLDSLQAGSLLFTQAHSVAPYTQASFPGLLTSGYLFDAPREPRLSAKRVLVSEALQARGIVTAAFHSNPYLSGYFGWNRGWDSFYDSMQEEVDDYSPYIRGHELNAKVEQWLQAVDPGRPFFLWVHYMDVHEPYVPERRHLERVDAGIALTREKMLALFKEVVLPRDASNGDTVELLRKLYQARVCEVDEHAQELFQLLDRRGVLPDTVVILTTDHGDEFGEHGGLSHDGKMYDELVHVPLLVVNPPQPAGGRCDKLVSGLDIPPTVLHLFGLEPEPAFQGRSLLPPQDYPVKGLYGEAIGKLAHRIKESDRPVYYYRAGSLKIIYRQEEDRWELYDLAGDAAEQNNLIEVSPQAGALKEKLLPRIGREPK